MTHPGLFDGQQRRDDAIDRVGEHADTEWKAAVALAIRFCAKTRDAFTTDEVWSLLTGRDATHEPRAMGAMMQEAKRAGVIAPTKEWRESARPECHARPCRVWRSLLRGENG